MSSCQPKDIGVPQPSSNVPGQKSSEPVEVSFPQGSNGTQLRTYRLALACTGEYAQYHGGTKPLVLSAMTTTMNRVNGIYRSELSLRMELVSNNDDLIFLDPQTDQYSNNDGVAMLAENKSKINSVIGLSGYDIGHVFSTGGGGVAYLGVVCHNGYKAGGVTGLPNPIGDPFDVEYVSHEMGHQWGAEHTFNNSCGGNRNSSTAYEPGSGSTIMSYAGICSPNIQNYADGYFHNHSYNQIRTFSVNGSGNSCAVITSSNNSPPEVSVPSSGFSIPKSTPFELTASAIDPYGDEITYCREQYDLGPASYNNLTNPSGKAPIFRSWAPTSNPTRVFPRISDLVNNTTVIGELLPTYARNLKFKCTVRDSYITGAVNDAQVAFQVAGNSGPFLVTSPNTSTTWNGGSAQTVTWNVANTTASPVSCSTVDIYLSTDGGFTYPTLLLANTTNNGSAVITIPEMLTTKARIKVKASSNIFFDISNQNFTIDAQAPTPENDQVCNAITISCGESFSGSSAGATPSSIGNPACAYGSQKDVFFKFIALANVNYSVTVNGDNYDGVIAAYTGSCSGTLTQIACADNGFTTGVAETVYISVPTDQEVIIQTYNWNSLGQADFTFTLNCPVPDNDDCADADTLPVNDSGACPATQVEGTTYGATASNPEACEPNSPDVYYKFHSGNNTEVIINLAYISAVDLVLSLFETSCSSEASFCHMGGQPKQITVTPNTTYYVRVHSWSASQAGTFSICIEKTASEIATINGSVSEWNSNCGERDATVKFYEPGTTTEASSYNMSIQADGSFNIPELETGTFDVIVKVDGYLAKGIQNVEIATGDNSLALGVIMFGDFNNDNNVNYLDVSLLVGAYLSTAGEPEYGPLTDYNCDGTINYLDISAIVESYLSVGDSVPLVP